MKRLLNYYFQIFVNYFCSIWIGVAALLLILPIRLFFKPSILAENIIISVLITLFAGVSLMLLCRKTSLEYKNSNILLFIVSLLSLFAFQHIITYCLNFYGPHFAGAAEYLANALFAPNEEFPELSQSVIHGTLFAIQFLIYLPLAITGTLLGAKETSIVTKTENTY